MSHQTQIDSTRVHGENDSFFSTLPTISDFAQSIQFEFYKPLPDDWLVVVADVQGSTQAIENGRYKDVNSIGVACIAAVVNAVSPLQIPYVFGGDGATFAIPATVRTRVASALAASRDLAAQAFGLHLRVGMVNMAYIRTNNHDVRVAHYHPHEHHRQAMFLGDGMGFAEQLVKDPRADNPHVLSNDGSIAAVGDFTGFECRWNEIASPHDEIISLLVQATTPDVAAQEAVYAHVLMAIRRIYGTDETSHPLRPERMKLSTSPHTLRSEIAIKTVKKTWWGRFRYTAKLVLLTLIGRYLMRRRIQLGAVNWGAYKATLIANTDHRKFDDVLRMIIAGTVSQRQELRHELEALHRSGQLIFGIHAAKSALITCVISDYATNHVHFLDAADGGYALAAKEMKAMAG